MTTTAEIQEELRKLKSKKTPAVTGEAVMQEFEVIKNQDLQWHQVIGRAFKNTPQSGYDFVNNIIQAVIHPIETGKAMGKMALGAVESAVPGSEYILPGPVYDRGNKEIFDSMVAEFKKNYGSVEGFKRALANDPVMVFADVASITSGVGGVARGGGIAAKASGLKKAGDVIETAGKTVQKAGAYMDPLQAPKWIVKLGDYATPKIRGMTLAQRMYDSAVKWNTVTGKPGMAGYEVRKRLSTTALENKIMPTIKGIEKLEDKLAALENKIAELVKTPTDAGVTIRADELLSEFDKLRKEAWRAGTGTSKKDVRQINAIEKDFIDVHGVWRVEIEDEVFVISRPQDRRPGQAMPKDAELIGFESLTPEQIQSKKIDIYNRLRQTYEKVRAQPASVKARKTIARTAKDILAELTPELDQANKTYGPLKELHKAIDQKANRISNRDLMGIGTGIKAAGGGALFDTVGAWLGVAFGILDDPLVKSKLAILIHHMKKRGIEVKPTTAALDLGLYQTGKEAIRQEELERNAVYEDAEGRRQRYRGAGRWTNP